MQALLIAGFVTLAAAALPDKAILKSIFIDGQGIKSPGMLTQAQIDSIDRELTIEYDLPAFTMGSAMPSPFDDTCGLPTISCPADKFSLTPGMEVSTISVRGHAATSASDYMTKVSPTIKFNMNAGQKYSFLMLDGLSGAPFWAQGMSATVMSIKHYSVVNMDQSSGLSADLKTSYNDPGNIVAATPNIYAFLVWEHTQNATQPGDIGAMNMQFTAQKWIEAAGIADAKLVAMNYFKCHGNVYSRASLKNGTNAWMAPTCTAGNYSAVDKMCMSSGGSTAAPTTMAPGATMVLTTTAPGAGAGATSEGASSAGSTISLERSLIFCIALAMTVSLH